jgi:acetyl esterase/lipase
VTLPPRYASRERHRDPDVSPLYADLTGMPTALFSCGTPDPLLDDTFFMAARWQAAGSRPRLAVYPGAPHEFLRLRDAISAAADARERMVGLIDRALTGDGPATQLCVQRSSDSRGRRVDSGSRAASSVPSPAGLSIRT